MHFMQINKPRKKGYEAKGRQQQNESHGIQFLNFTEFISVS